MERVDVGDRLAGRRHEQVALGDPGRLGGRALLDATDEDPVELREPDRCAQPPGHVRRGDRDPEAGTLARLAAGQGVDAGLERGVGRQREVEALAHPVRVEPDERAIGVEERGPGRPGRERRRVLERAGDPAPAGPRNARSTDETKPNETRAAPDGVAAAANTAEPMVPAVVDQAIGVAPSCRRSRRRDRRPSQRRRRCHGWLVVGEADRDLGSAKVVGVGEDGAVGDDDPGPAGAGSDADDGRGGGGRDGCHGFLELCEQGHGGVIPRWVRARRSGVASNLRSPTTTCLVTMQALPYHWIPMTEPEATSVPPTALAAALDRVGDRWSLLVVELLGGSRRFNELGEAVPGIAPNILSDRLRRLERSGSSWRRPTRASQSGWSTR